MQDAIGRLWDERTLAKQALLQISKATRAVDARAIASEALARLRA